MGDVSGSLIVQFVIGTVFAVLILGAVRHLFRGEASAALMAVAGWLAIALVLVAGYSFRSELGFVASRVAGTVVPGLASEEPGGAVAFTRGAGGSFIVRGEVNGERASFIFDTGASSVVLTAETARRLGLRLTDADFTVSVATANGRTRAAPVVLDRLSVGTIEERRVSALVARQGALVENLLGMSFLERLASYEVAGDRLIMRPDR
jgi:aspartyl protease family protein